MIQIDSLDHLVLTVADIEQSCLFYRDVLGFEVRHVAGRWALHFGRQKINLHQRGREFEPKALVPTPGAADLCFISADTLDEIVAHLARMHVTVEVGPVDRLGATGPLRSVYIRDPDGNLIEVSNRMGPDSTPGA